MKRRENYYILYDLLVEFKQNKSTVTLDEILKVTTWKKSTFFNLLFEKIRRENTFFRRQAGIFNSQY